MLEIIVVSDDSSDNTENIINTINDPRVRLIRQIPRAGKTSALNLAVPRAKGEIIVFSDANSQYDRKAIRHLINNFADPDVGYVTGKMIYIHPNGNLVGNGCSAYMKYENFLRLHETNIGSVVGVDGGIDAMRKSLYQPLSPDQLPDFVQPLKIVEQGYRVVYEPKALLMEKALTTTKDEHRMRVRVTLRALWALHDMRSLLFFPRNLLFSWQLWSHKVLRYTCFIFLFLAFFSNIMLLNEGTIFQVFFALQCGVYSLAVIVPLLTRFGFSPGRLGLPSYFVLLNLACAHAFGKFILRKKQITWTPRKG